MTERQSRALTETIYQINKQFGICLLPGSLVERLKPSRVIPTGIPGLDKALGIGGIPAGRVIEIHGGEDSGKSALALQIINQLPADCPALYIDADHHRGPMMESNGNVYVLDVDTLEDAFEACRIAAPAFSIIVIDTLAALPTSEQRENDIGVGQVDIGYGRVIEHALRVLVPLLAKTGCTLIAINQMRERVNVMYGNPERPTGGKVLGYYAAMKLELRRIAYNKDFQTSRVQIVKNKCAPPYREVKFTIDFNRGGLLEAI